MSKSPEQCAIELAAPTPFELRLVAFGHGWIDLPPFTWRDQPASLHTVLDLGTASAARPVDVAIERTTESALRLTLRSTTKLGANHRARVAASVHRMLRLDQDLTPFWRRCATEPSLRWAGERGAGRLLRGSSVFEDLLKLLFTTNCSWAATRKMSERLVAALGAPAPSGARAFPAAARCAAQSAQFWRDEVRVGYRATACQQLAEAFASGALSETQFNDPALDTAELRRHLLALRGFGPYAAGQALRLLGHYDDLALDSWCRARLAELRGKRRPPSDRSVAREYARYGEWAGLALWLHLTAAWHVAGAGKPAALA